MAAYSANAQAVCSADDSKWIMGGKYCLKINTYKNPSVGDKPTLVVVLHGDSPFNNPGYQYRTARVIAEKSANTIAVGLLRPGYTDSDSNKSTGTRGEAIADNYTADVIESIADAVEKLKKIHRAGKVVLVGHSGGAAIVGGIIGTKKNAADAAILVSCPCNVAAFRAHMKKLQDGNPIWDKPVTSISPHGVVGKIGKKTKVVLIVGSVDEVTPSSLSRDYLTSLKKRRLQAELFEIKDKGHDILLETEVINIITAAVTKITE